MTNRPLLEPKLRLAAKVEQASERITPSREDTIEAQLNRQLNQKDFQVPQGMVTVQVVDNELIFDIGDNVSSVRELGMIEGEIVEAVRSNGIDIDETDIAVKADIVKTFDLTGGL